VGRNKTDRTDTEGMLEANRCAGIQPVPVKSIEQQALHALHRVRTQWQATRTNRINVLRGLLREHGYPVPVGARTVLTRVTGLLEDPASALLASLRALGLALVEEVRTLEARVADLDRQLAQVAHEDPVATRLQQIPGVGVVTATALVGAISHIHAFPRGRDFASWLGLTPRESTTGTRRYPGRISKRGDGYLRCLLTHWRARRSARRGADRARPATPSHTAPTGGGAAGHSTRPQPGGDRARQSAGAHHLGRVVSGGRFLFASGTGRVRRRYSPDEMAARDDDHGVTGRTGAEPGR
jgi:transposase